MTYFLVLFVLLEVFEVIHSNFPQHFPIHTVHLTEDEIKSLDPPLILTTYIKENRTKEGREASEVKNEAFLNVTSYSGYLTVNEQHGSNLFFWFFPSETDYENAPLLLWLQGGPGSSSMYGLFREHGPFKALNDTTLELREERWTIAKSVIYIDNPAGTGFSFTDSTSFCKNQTQVADELYNALQQFFQLFPELQQNEFFATGESYGGKYVPSLSYTIFKNNPTADLKINLKGLSIGDGLTDPINQLDFSDFLYQHGLIDVNVKKNIDDLQDDIADLAAKGNYKEATTNYLKLFLGVGDEPTLYENATGLKNAYNYLEEKVPTDPYSKFVQTALIRNAIHVGNSSFSSDGVYDNLYEDIVKSAAPYVSELLSHYRVLLYSGLLDVIVAYPVTENYLQMLNFSAAEEYKSAPRNIWRVDGEVAGYVKQAGNLTEVLIRNAGHMAPMDQPKWAYDVVDRFVKNLPYY